MCTCHVNYEKIRYFACCKKFLILHYPGSWLGSGRVLWPPRATEFKWWLSGRYVDILSEENVNFALKNFKLLRQSTRKVNKKLRLFLNFIIFVRASHCDYSFQKPKYLATPLIGSYVGGASPSWSMKSWQLGSTVFIFNEIHGEEHSYSRYFIHQP